MGTLLVLSGFALWPARPGAPLLVREAWDAPRFWTLGLPLLLLVQAIAAGARNDVAIRRRPLRALVGLLAGIILLRPAAGVVVRRVGDAIQG